MARAREKFMCNPLRCGPPCRSSMVAAPRQNAYDTESGLVQRGLARKSEAVAKRQQKKPRPAYRTRLRLSWRERWSIAVMLGLERPFDRHADIVGLLLAELGQLHAQLFEVQLRDLLVEMLGQDVDVVLVLVRLGEQLDLRQRLVSEARRHHE